MGDRLTGRQLAGETPEAWQNRIAQYGDRVIEWAGLMWVGDRFYTTESFKEEAAKMGISKRLTGPPPKWFDLGSMWVYCAHINAIRTTCAACKGAGSECVRAVVGAKDRWGSCPTCGGLGRITTPGVFFAFKPSRVEKIVSDQITAGEFDKLVEAGIHPVPVPHDDPDHR
jgi:hypothetical protein